MAGYLYTPPTYRQFFVMKGALRSYIDVSTTVYRLGGTWFNVLVPGIDSPVIADLDVASDGTLCCFNTPAFVPNELHDGLAALLPADSSWTPGTLTAL